MSIKKDIKMVNLLSIPFIEEGVETTLGYSNTLPISQKAVTEALETKIEEAPIDNLVYGRRDGSWVLVNTGDGSFDVASNYTITGTWTFVNTTSDNIPEGNTNKYWSQYTTPIVKNNSFSVGEEDAGKFFRVGNNSQTIEIMLNTVSTTNMFSIHFYRMVGSSDVTFVNSIGETYKDLDINERVREDGMAIVYWNGNKWLVRGDIKDI